MLEKTLDFNQELVDELKDSLTFPVRETYESSEPYVSLEQEVDVLVGDRGLDTNVAIVMRPGKKDEPSQETIMKTSVAIWPASVMSWKKQSHHKAGDRVVYLYTASLDNGR